MSKKIIRTVRNGKIRLYGVDFYPNPQWPYGDIEGWRGRIAYYDHYDWGIHFLYLHDYDNGMIEQLWYPSEQWMVERIESIEDREARFHAARQLALVYGNDQYFIDMRATALIEMGYSETYDEAVSIAAGELKRLKGLES